MKSPRLSRTFILLAALTIGFVDARLIQPWTYQELLEKSDLVVIATPSDTRETKERINLPGFQSQPVTGVETTFTVSAVLKGEKSQSEITLHHYKAEPLVPNGPLLISFDPEKHDAYLLFLVREADGRYAPAFGQKDPAACGISKLQPPSS